MTLCYAAHHSFFSQSYNLRQRVVLKWDNNDDIRTTDHRQPVSTRRIYPNFVLSTKCQKMHYMRHVEPKPGQSFLHTF